VPKTGNKTANSAGSGGRAREKKSQTTLNVVLEKKCLGLFRWCGFGFYVGGGVVFHPLG